MPILPPNTTPAPEVRAPSDYQDYNNDYNRPDYNQYDYSSGNGQDYNSYDYDSNNIDQGNGFFYTEGWGNFR